MFKLFKRKSRAERNEQIYRKWLKGHFPKISTHKIELERVFTTRNHVNYYVAKSIGSITMERANKIEQAMISIHYGVAKSEITETLTEIKNAIEDVPYSRPKDLKGYIKSNAARIDEILYRMNNITTEDVILHAASLFFFVDNEDPYLVDPDVTAQKFTHAKEDLELKSFFLQTMEIIFRQWADSRQNTPT